MSDRKHMKKVREKRIKSVQKQIDAHEDKIENEKGRKDTTIGYWEKEIEKKFKKVIDEDKRYLQEESK